MYENKKILQSLKLIEGLYSHTQKNIIAFSGGKDSIVLYHLAKITQMPFDIIYANTTIDPPGHIKFIKDNYSDVKISNPKLSFYKIIEKYGLPTRMSRFCCQHLKEYIVSGCKVFEGLRIDEGVKRGKRLSGLKEPEQCDTRIKGKIHAYPIMQWSNFEIWDYIKHNNLPYPEIYNNGFNRLGCIGCPLSGKSQVIYEFKMFPRYIYPIIKSIRKNIESGKSLSKFFKDPYSAFFWWISATRIIDHNSDKLFKTNYEDIIKKTFNI